MSATRVTENIVQDVKTHLNTYHMLAYESWLSGCVEYFVAERYTLTEIKNNAYQQWLMHDLRYICPGSLPENLADLDKTILNGKFVLQMNSALDISVPAYQQYLKLKKTDTENIKATMNPEENISSKRMLKFELTDGKQTISGMEYETISKLKAENIVPGCKVMIIGPVQCRQGMLLLTNSVVEFLGGEVENMSETHSLAAQLASKLNLPLIENVSNESTPITQSTNRDTLGETSTKQNRSHNDVTNRQISRLNQTNANPGTGTNNTREEALKNSYANKRPLETESAPEKKIKLDELVDDVDLNLFEEEDMRAIEECERLYSSNTPVTLSAEPFVYLKQINELNELEKSGKVFRVKAQIQNVLTKLTMTPNREWNLKCTIIDGTGCMDVEFSSDILSKFLGYTPENISELKKKVATNPGLKKDINAAYVKTAETLKTLYCIMELTMCTLPKITRLIDFEDSHVKLLNKRLNNVDVTLKISLISNYFKSFFFNKKDTPSRSSFNNQLLEMHIYTNIIKRKSLFERDELWNY